MIEQNRVLRDAVLALAGAVERYCDNPGCNIPARKTAITKLLWAAEQARRTISG